ncbi:hypothetical protein [Thiobacillus sp.]|uniref:hypothetical protein n=1 Tax=Thiobacillus sp. TaxID=924 RepID=UPI0025EC1182|nr:hypothetical protein [Thiobacillus sp.]
MCIAPAWIDENTTRSPEFRQIFIAHSRSRTAFPRWIADSSVMLNFPRRGLI